MTSSPVDVSDGVADKLFLTAPVAPQDAQDALQEATRTPQALAESVANSPRDRTDGLDADQGNASIDADAPIIHQTNMHPGVTTAENGCDAEAHIRTASLTIDISSRSLTDADGVALEPHMATSSITADDRQEASRIVTLEPAFTIPTPTDMTLPAPGLGKQSRWLLAEDQPEEALHGIVPDHAARSPDKAEYEASSITDTGQKSSKSKQVAIDSFISNDDKGQEEGNFSSTGDQEMNQGDEHAVCS
jgi:hypothetical protein